MSLSIIISIIVSVVSFAIFFSYQLKFNSQVKQKREKFESLFAEGTKGYQVKTMESPEGESYMQIDGHFEEGTDLRTLIDEINDYVKKSKGTTDFSVIQNKTERLIDMRYDDSTARMSFPIYLGLMGTFCGVFIGIISFLCNVWMDSVNDDSIKGLLIGVLVSMSTSFIGLFLTTRNNYYSSDGKRKVDIDKNKFYDFIQTELMPSLDVSMVAALNKLHDTVTMFEPSFNRVIDRFQTTFDSCTKSFGNQFAENVKVVSRAVAVMGENMDKINQNIHLQQQLLSTIKSNSIANGLQAFVEATDHFTELTNSLNQFEKARRMMLRATDEVINMQKQYAESLEMPKELVIKVNAILDRVTKFEDSINALGKNIEETQLIGNDTINLINEQLSGIKKKGKIADKYLGLADGKLEELYSRQTAAIGHMTHDYEEAIKAHIDGFKTIIDNSTEDFNKRHEDFVKALDEKFNVDEVHEDFSNLKKLNDINSQLTKLNDLEAAFTKYQTSLNEVKGILEDIKKMAKSSEKKEEEKGGFFGLFGGRKDKD